MSIRPWTVHYDEGVPTTLAPYADETLIDMVRRCAQERPDAPALRFEGAVTSYGMLVREAEAFARALEGLGVKRGDRVSLLLPNSPQFVIAELGAWLVGAVVAPMNPTYPEEEMAPMLARAGSTVAVVLSPFYEVVKRAQPRTAIRTVVLARLRDALPFPKSLLFRLLLEKKLGHAATVRDGDHEMTALLAAHRGQRPASEPPRPGEPALLLPSGGTTGTPKWVLGSHGGLAISGKQVFTWLSPVLTPHDTLLVPLPLFHVYAAAGVLPLAWQGGLAMALVPNPRDTKALLATIRREEPSFLCCVPTLLAAMLAHPDAAKTREAFGKIKLTFSGGAALMAETKKRFEELTGGVVMEGYSLTEAQMAVVGNPAVGEKKVGSVGMPLPDVDLRIVDVETGTRELAQGESGEVLLAAPQLMCGYWDQADETAAVLRTDEAGRRWLSTGDIGYLDADGYLFLTDRKKELIKVSGYQVWPREVEEAVTAHPAVLEAGVTAIPDAAKGEVPKAWVVMRPGRYVEPAELRAFCKERLAPYKVPAQIVVVDELPKTPTGKVLRRKLHELNAARAPVTAARQPGA